MKKEVRAGSSTDGLNVVPSAKRVPCPRTTSQHMSNVDCAPTSLWSTPIFNGQQYLEALRVRKVAFFLGIVGEFTSYQSKRK
jgi:hypothetical protein